jgi:hypothetical protein
VSEQNPPPAAGSTKFRPHGLYAVYGGLISLVILNSFAIWAFHKDVTNAVAAIGAISSPIVAMVSAYFGIKVGSQTGNANAAASNEARTTADNQVKTLLGKLTPEQAAPIMQELGIMRPSASGPAPNVGGVGQ